MYTGLSVATQTLLLSLFLRHTASFNLFERNVTMKNLKQVNIHTNSPLLTLPKTYSKASYQLSNSLFSRISHSVFMSSRNMRIYRTMFSKIDESIIHYSREGECQSNITFNKVTSILQSTCYSECTFEGSLLTKNNPNVSFYHCVFCEKTKFSGDINGLILDNCLALSLPRLSSCNYALIKDTNMTNFQGEIKIKASEETSVINYCYITFENNPLIYTQSNIEIEGLFIKSEVKDELIEFLSNYHYKISNSIFNAEAPYFYIYDRWTPSFSFTNCCFATPFVNYSSLFSNQNESLINRLQITECAEISKCEEIVYVKKIDYEVRRNKKADLRIRLRNINWSMIY